MLHRPSPMEIGSSVGALIDLSVASSDGGAVTTHEQREREQGREVAAGEQERRDSRAEKGEEARSTGGG